MCQRIQGNYISMMDNMASPSNGSHTKVDRVEIDTRAPFESVKAAVSLFGDKGIGDKIYKKNLEIRTEKGQISKETELHILQKDLFKIKEQLKTVDATKTQAQVELLEAKKVAEVLSLKLEKVTDSKKKANEASQIAQLRAEELVASNVEVSKDKISDWQSEVTTARNDHLARTAELESVKLELRKLKQEVLNCVEAKTFAVKQAEESMSKTEMYSRRVEELTKDINEAHMSHALVKQGCIEAEKGKKIISTERQGEAQKASAGVEQIRKQILEVTRDLAAAKNKEKELGSTTAAIENLKNELNLTKVSESKDCSDACSPVEKLKKVREEIDNTKKKESDAHSALESRISELAQAKEDLKKATEEICSLRASMNSLKAELGNKKAELVEINETEAQAEAKAADLNSELHKARLKLEAAIAAEAKAKDASSDLSQTIHNLTAEAYEAKREAEFMKEETQKAKLEIEQAKADMITINSRLEAGHKELEEARVAEAIAVKKIKELSERADVSRASTSESGAGITISLSEFDFFGRKVEEADKLVDKKVAAAMAQIDAIKAGEQEISMKLEVACREIEELKSAEQQELRMAERAIAAKSAIERELVRWREREEQKVTPHRASDLLPSEKNSFSMSFIESKIMHSEPLVKELNVNNVHVEPVNLWSASFSQKKNKLIPSIRRLFTRKKRIDSSSKSVLK